MTSILKKIICVFLSFVRRNMPEAFSKQKRHARALIAAAALFSGVVRRMTYQQSHLIESLFRKNSVFSRYFSDLEDCYILVSKLSHDLNVHISAGNFYSGKSQIEIFRLLAVITDNLDTDQAQELLEFARAMVRLEDYDCSSEAAVSEVYELLVKALCMSVSPAVFSAHFAATASQDAQG
jgi:hypothetical protein